MALTPRKLDDNAGRARAQGRPRVLRMADERTAAQGTLDGEPGSAAGTDGCDRCADDNSTPAASEQAGTEVSNSRDVQAAPSEARLSNELLPHVARDVKATIENRISDAAPISSDPGRGNPESNQGNTEKDERLERLIALGKSSQHYAKAPTPEIDWIVDGALESNALAMLYGDSGIGKTFVAMHLAYCIGSGKRWFNRKCEKTRVLYLDGENGAGLIHRRSKLIDPEGEADIIYCSFPDLSLQADDLSLMGSLVKALKAGVVVIDPLMTFMHGDENSIEDVRPQLRGLRALGEELDIAIVLIHHENRSGTFRGSSGFKDLATLQLHFKTSSIEADGFQHVLDVVPNKQRQSVLDKFTMAWRVVDGEFTAGGLSTMQDSPTAKIVKACERIKDDTGEWPGKTEVIRAKDQHGLSRTEASKALQKAIKNHDIKPRGAPHNKLELWVPGLSIEVSGDA